MPQLTPEQIIQLTNDPSIKATVFDNGTITIKTKGSKVAIQLQKSDGLHTLGMIIDGKVVKDFGQMGEVLALLKPTKIVEIKIEEGVNGTVKFIRQSRRPVAVIMFDYEMDCSIEEMKEKFEADWKATTRQYGLQVELA